MIGGVEILHSLHVHCVSNLDQQVVNCVCYFEIFEDLLL